MGCPPLALGRAKKYRPASMANSCHEPPKCLSKACSKACLVGGLEGAEQHGLPPAIVTWPLVSHAVPVSSPSASEGFWRAGDQQPPHRSTCSATWVAHRLVERRGLWSSGAGGRVCWCGCRPGQSSPSKTSSQDLPL